VSTRYGQDSPRWNFATRCLAPTWLVYLSSPSYLSGYLCKTVMLQSGRPSATTLAFLACGPAQGTCSFLPNQLDPSTVSKEVDDATFPHSASRRYPPSQPHYLLASATSTALPTHRGCLHRAVRASSPPSRSTLFAWLKSYG
jgi:hypothetical protein